MPEFKQDPLHQGPPAPGKSTIPSPADLPPEPDRNPWIRIGAIMLTLCPAVWIVLGVLYYYPLFAEFGPISWVLQWLGQLLSLTVAGVCFILLRAAHRRKPSDNATWLFVAGIMLIAWTWSITADRPWWRLRLHRRGYEDLATAAVAGRIKTGALPAEFSNLSIGSGAPGPTGRVEVAQSYVMIRIESDFDQFGFGALARLEPGLDRRTAPWTTMRRIWRNWYYVTR